MATISDVKAREILDSRGTPTIEVEVTLEGGTTGRAAVPSGASTGAHEACELRDGDKGRFLGKGVLTAVENVNTKLRPEVLGLDPLRQGDLDRLLIQLDGTENKTKHGANAILGVSLAAARAAASSVGLPLWRYIGGVQARTLPTPQMNLINGGKHADSGMEIQEFMIVPLGFQFFRDSLRAGVEVFQHLKQILKRERHITAVGDEGGFAPRLETNEAALRLLVQATESAGYVPGEQVAIALDSAASEFFDEEKNLYTFDGKEVDAPGLVEIYSDYCDKYPIVSIEDGMAEDDWDGWKAQTAALGSRVQLVGDDIFVTNTSRLERGIDEEVANSILIKVNQIGTLTETLETMQLANLNGYSCVISHRSGETEDAFISDLAVATGCGQIKTGAASRSDRMCKYNQLLRIEEQLGEAAIFAGNTTFACL
ncbi:MAG: phosphopyruvate hydratase [Proteobacteria bacterium]|nr:phosphopyruvate hydratase [Pseudomonadota bacterium]